MRKLVARTATYLAAAALVGSLAAPVASAANTAPETMTCGASCTAVAGTGAYIVFTGGAAGAAGSQYAYTVTGGSWVANSTAGDFAIVGADGLISGSARWVSGQLAVADGTKLEATDHVWVGYTGTKDVVISEYKWGSGSWAATGNTYTATFINASDLAVSASKSFVKIVGPSATCALNAGGTAFTEDAVAAAAASAANVAKLCVKVVNGAGSAVDDATVSATITGAGIFGASAVSSGSTNGSGIYSAVISGSSIAGTGRIAITATRPSSASVTLAGASMVFTGPVASITATVNKAVVSKDSDGDVADVVRFTAKDANGNSLATTGSTLVVTGTVFSTVTGAAASTEADPNGVTIKYGTAAIDCNGTAGSGTVAVKNGTITSNAVTVYCSGDAATATLAFDKASTTPGGAATLVFSAKDAAGNPAALAAEPWAVVNGGVLFGGKALPNGTYSWSFFAPAATGTVTAMATYGELSELTATVKVGTVAKSAASALGKTTSGSFSTTSKVAYKGKYATIRFSFGSANAGASVKIFRSAKRADGTWTSYSQVTSRTANSTGNVFFYTTSSTAKTYRFRASVSGTTNAVAVRWR